MMHHLWQLVTTGLLLATLPGASCLQPLATSPSKPRLQPWRKASIDYSAANEFIHAHYGNLYPESSPYFTHCSQDHVKEEPIFDAREGVYDDDAGVWRESSSTRCGFALHRAPTAVTDWEDLGQIKSHYVDELRKLITDAFAEEEDLSVLHMVFWHPMFRGEDTAMASSSEGSPPTAPVASMVHIDTDVGALEVEDLVRLVEHNRVVEDTEEASPTEPFPRKELVNALREGRRFAIVNAWRNADFDHPIGRAPLAVLATRYSGTACFPEARPDPTSRWYTFSQMKWDECLLFKQYDRNMERPSDLWHCAPPIAEREAPPRRSFDIRAFVVFDQKVPPALDRFKEGRARPLLTYEESGCFCEAQALERQASSNDAS